MKRVLWESRGVMGAHRSLSWAFETPRKSVVEEADSERMPV